MINKIHAAAIAISSLGTACASDYTWRYHDGGIEGSFWVLINTRLGRSVGMVERQALSEAGILPPPHAETPSDADRMNWWYCTAEDRIKVIPERLTTH